MKRTKIYQLISNIVGLGIFNLIAFLVIPYRDNTFWFSYIFTSLAFLNVIIISILTMSDDEVKKDPFLGLPIYMHSIFYLVVQLIAGIILMATDVEYKIAIIIQVIILGVFIIIFVTLLRSKDQIINVEKKVEMQSAFMRMLTVRAENLYNIVSDFDKKNELKRLFEAIRYSDPMSSTPEICRIDEKIDILFNQVEQNLCHLSVGNLNKSIDEIINQLTVRNSLCKSSK